MTELGERILAAAEEEKEAMISFLMELASMESPSDVPESQIPVQAYLTTALEELGFQVEKTPGPKDGRAPPGQAERMGIRTAHPSFMLGHCDTVWKQGTLETMPVEVEGNRLKGPGVFDMKAGLTQMIFALRILRKLGLEPEVTPVILINSDEEIGSPESGAGHSQGGSRGDPGLHPGAGNGAGREAEDGPEGLGPVHPEGDGESCSCRAGSQRVEPAPFWSCPT